MLTALGMALAMTIGQPVNDVVGDDTTFSERQPVRLAPLPAERAFAAFRDVCMAHLGDPAGFDQAAATAGLDFVRAEHPERGTQEYNSRHGQIILRHARNQRRETRRDRREGRVARQRWVDRCDYWVAIEEMSAPEALVATIGRALAPQATAVEEIIGYSWALGSPAPGTSLRLVYLPSNDDPRLFTLSLQRLADTPAR
jgi:hypothetical protein